MRATVMTISDFWNQAFIASLGRLPIAEAKAEADEALAVAIAHWQEVMKERGVVVPVWGPYADLDVAAIKKSH